MVQPKASPRTLAFWKPYFPDWLTLVSAIWIVLSFPPWKISWLIWVALVPWFHSVFHARNWTHAFAKGAWLSFFMSAMGFYWVAYVLKNFGGVPWSVAIALFGVYAPFAQAQFIAFAILGRVVMRWELSHGTSPGRLVLSIAGLALSYAGLNWLLPKLFQDSLGHSLYLDPVLRQLASLGGVWCLTSLVLLVNLSLFVAYRRLRMRREKSLWPELRMLAPTLLLLVASVATAQLAGRHLLTEVTAWQSGSMDPVRTVRAGVVQANIGDIEKLAAETGLRGAAREILGRHYTLSRQLLSLVPKPHFIVWPETAYPSTFRTPETPDELDRDQQLEREAKSWGVPLLFGGYDQDRTLKKDYNAFFFLSHESGSAKLEVYRKHILLLFGEYIPGAESITWIRNLFPQVGYFGRGPGAQVVSVPIDHPEHPTLKMSPLICYEVLYPSYTLPAVREGVDFLMNITNDSWFGPTAEPELHLALSTFRAVETRRPLVRSTNTGISALILPDGSIAQRGGLFREESLSFEIPILPQMQTRILAWGDWFGPFALIAGLVCLGLLWRSSSRLSHA